MIAHMQSSLVFPQNFLVFGSVVVFINTKRAAQLKRVAIDTELRVSVGFRINDVCVVGRDDLWMALSVNIIYELWEKMIEMRLSNLELIYNGMLLLKRQLKVYKVMGFLLENEIFGILFFIFPVAYR